MSGHCTSPRDWGLRISEMPFFEYAACNWGRHARDCEAQLLKNRTIRTILRKQQITSSVAQALQPTLQDIAGNKDCYSLRQWAQAQPKDAPAMPALHILAYFDLQELANEWLCQKQVDANCLSPRGYTALWLACHLGHTAIVELLLEQGADPGLQNGHGRFCLASAVMSGHMSIVNCLLDYDITNWDGEKLLSQVDWQRRSVFLVAVAAGRADIFHALLEHAASMRDRSELLLKQEQSEGRGVLHEAACLGHCGLIEVLFGASSQEDIQKYLFQKQLHGKTPLHCAVQRSPSTHSKIVSLLLRNGADPCITDNEQATALHEAAAHGRADHVKALLGVSRTKDCLEATNARSLTPLQLAWKGRPKDFELVIDLFQRAGARPPNFATCGRRKAGKVTQGDAVYMESFAIPSSWRLLILRITFTIESQDQGYADFDNQHDGTYMHSFTWFDAGIWRNGSVIRRRLLTNNIRAKAKPTMHEISWDVDHGSLGGDSRAHGKREQEQVKDFLKELRAGDKVVLILRAIYQGWINMVHRAEMKFFYVE